MDTNPQRPDDLSEWERRLSAWEPAAEGLHPDAMLFAAGRAAARSGSARFVWPALACFLSVLAAVLGVWLAAERTERRLLAQRLRHQPTAPSPSPSLPVPALIVPEEPPIAEEAAPDSFLAARRALEHGLDDWPARAVVRADPPDPTPPNPSVLRVGQHDALLDP